MKTAEGKYGAIVNAVLKKWNACSGVRVVG